MKIPSGEILWCTYYDNVGSERHIVTSNQIRSVYYLYEISGEKLKKLGRASNPIELEDKFFHIKH